MKKLIITTIALAILLSLSACKQLPESPRNISGSQPENSDSNNYDNNTPETDLENENQASQPNEQEPSKVYMINSMFQSFDAAELKDNADLIITASFDGTISTFTVDENVGTYRSDLAYTQQFVTPTVTIKGNAPETVNIRRIGGINKEGIPVTSNDPELTSGKSYLLYLRENEPASQDDEQSFCIIDFFEIKTDGTLDTKNRSEQDAATIIALYNEHKS